MNTNYLENNHLVLVGKIVSDKSYSHEIYGEKFYVFNLEVVRLSSTVDIIPITISIIEIGERIIKQFNQSLPKINQTIIQKGVKFSTYVYLTGIPGIALYIYDESSRKKAKNQVEDYYKGSKGKITLLNAELSDWKEKKTKAETRLSEKESDLSKYYGYLKFEVPTLKRCYHN